MACYRTTSTGQQRDLAAAAAAVADEAGFSLLIDLRPGRVILDSGKDQWVADAHGLDLDFADLARRLQTAARDLGATTWPTLPRFVQLFLDTADVDAVRAFWAAALGYDEDRRADLTDIVDPLRLNPCSRSRRSTPPRQSGSGSATASTSSSRCRPTRRRLASAPRSPPAVDSSTSRTVAAASPTPRATSS